MTERIHQVLTAGTPAGPFSHVGQATVARTGSPHGLGDFDLFTDGAGNAYIAYDILFGPSGAYNIYVEKLSSDYQSGSGVVVDTGASGEGLAAFMRGGVTYVVYGASGCAFCNGTPARYVKATNPLGAYSASAQINANSCGGQPHKVLELATSTGTAYVFQSDLWAPGGNQSLGGTFRTELQFDNGGNIQPFGCPANSSLSLASTASGSPVSANGVDQSSGAQGFTHWGSDQLHAGAGGYEYLQTFTPATTGAVRTVSVSLYKKGSATSVPNAGVSLTVVGMSGQMPSSTLYTAVIPHEQVSWASSKVAVAPPSLLLNAGTSYGIVIGSAAQPGTGSYGFDYNDGNPYARGSTSYKAVGGSVWTNQAFRDVKFEVTMYPLTNPNGQVQAVPYASSSEEWAGGWSLVQSVDTDITSAPGNYGWVSAIERSATNHAEYIVANLGQSEPVGTVTMYPRNDAGAIGQNFPIDFTIDSSVDGLTWTTRTTQTNHAQPAAGQPQTFSLSPGVPSRFVRVRATNLRHQQGGYFFALAELGIW